jgi:hypothetical protein
MGGVFETQFLKCVLELGYSHKRLDFKILKDTVFWTKKKYFFFFLCIFMAILAATKIYLP